MSSQPDGASVKDTLRHIFDHAEVSSWVRTRFKFILAVFVIEAGLFVLFASLPISHSSLQSYDTSYNQTETSFRSIPPEVQVLSIFQNNAGVALGMFGPIFGQISFLVSSYNTARIIDAIASQSGASAHVLLLELYLYPHTWVETFAYAVAFSEGLFLLWSIVRGGKRNFKIGRVETELPYVIHSLAATGLLLGVAAVFEVGEAVVDGGKSPLPGLLFWIPFAVLLVATVVWVRRGSSSIPAVGADLGPAGLVAPVPTPSVDSIRGDIEARVGTDRVVSSAWIALPGLALISVLAFVIYGIGLAFSSFAQNPGTAPATPTTTSLPGLFSGFGYFALTTYAVLAVFLVLAYRLIKRRNDHFAREQLLFEDLAALIGDKAAQADQTGGFQAQLAAAQGTLQEIKANEERRTATIWVVACFFVGSLLPFVVYFLMKDFYNHERREERFLQQIAIAAALAGLNLGYSGRAHPLPNRSFAGYAVGLVFTYGLFTLYWLYRLINDPNEHFESQWDIEDRLYGGLSRDINDPGIGRPHITWPC